MARPPIDIAVSEVGPRDGLQNTKTFMPTAAKQAWIAAEAAAGVPEIEVCSFVPAKLIPQFADAEEVVRDALAIDGLEVAALVPNLKGAERAVAAGVGKLAFTLSVSRAHSLANVRRTPEQQLEELKRIVAWRATLTAERRPSLAVGLSTAFGCTLEGRIEAAAVWRLAEAAINAGADELALSDTVGYADPALVRRLFRGLRGFAGTVPLGGHFHDTRGLGLANALAAIEEGVTTLDSSLGGLGGCPFAPGASGNIATEDLVFMLEAMGLRTGIDLDRLLAARRVLAEGLPGAALFGNIARAGLPKSFRQPSSVV